MSIRIRSVDPDGLGAILGLKPGDRLMKINGRRIQDYLDYQFQISGSSLDLEMEMSGCKEVVAVEKDEDEDLGVGFEDFPIRCCSNDCIFCFINQNPPGLRESLYLRDEDYRLSFLYGNYITMTNLGKRDLDRIVEQRLSPLYISIHATESTLRQRLFFGSTGKNARGKNDNLLAKMRYLTDQGIILHGQIVICPTINDGSHLRRTLNDLLPLSPGLRSVTIVPVGLTAHRDQLYQIATVTPNIARDFLDEYATLDRIFRHSDGSRFVLPSDEWYLLAGHDVPSKSFYEDLAIEENGVGQVRAFLDRFQAEQDQLPRAMEHPTRFTIATGVLAEDLFRKYILPRLNLIDNLTVNLQVIYNSLYGESITVTGLLSGEDFISQLPDSSGDEGLGSAVWTTNRILNNDGERTLDDMTLHQISRRLGVPLNVAGDSVLEIFQRGIYA